MTDPVVVCPPCSFPKRRVPFWVVYLLALVMEAVARTLHNITGRIMLVPLLTRTEVAKCAITHYARVSCATPEHGNVLQCTAYTPC